jgi:dienelactone hydrolase
MMVTHGMMLADAFAALNLLQSHPQIDGERIAISGWSLGGTVALYAAWMPIIEALSPNGCKFAAHLPIYPAAHMRPEIQRWSDAPILALHGEIDDYTPLNFVTELATMIRPHGAIFDIHIYPNAHHSFDSVEPVIWHPTAIRLDHRTVTIDEKGDLWSEADPGVILPLNEPDERLAAFHYAKNIGAHFGGQEEARKHSFQFGTEFLIKHLN